MVTSQAVSTALRTTRSSLTPTIQRRGLQDVAITRTGKPIIRVQGGRSSLGGYTATVFGATGFLGRYIVNRLARQGCSVIVPYREEMAKRHLKVTGDLGRVNFYEFDLRNTQSIEESVRHSDIVFNLIGRKYPTKNFSYRDVHVEGTERIAEAVAKYDVDRFIHVSSYNADPKSRSEFYRTKVSITYTQAMASADTLKAQSERVARELYPETTIVRVAPLFGFEDNLLHKLAGVTNLFTSNHMRERFWPVHVGCLDNF
jgi:NADH dehydrogenase (ubiquinone) 1 alpha subcomplex subunit 9